MILSRKPYKKAITISIYQIMYSRFMFISNKHLYNMCLTITTKVSKKLILFPCLKTMSYSSSLVLWDMIILIFFQLKTPSISDNLLVFWHRYKLLDLIFHKEIVFYLHSFFLFRLIRIANGLI